MLNLFLSLLALLVAGTSAFVSFSDYLAGRENLFIEITKSRNEDATWLLNIDQDSDPDLVLTHWDIKLINNSDRPVSLKGITVSHTSRNTNYGGAHGDINTLKRIISEKSRISVPLPADLPSGKSARFEVIVPLPLDPRASSVLAENWEEHQEYSLSSLEQKLARRKLDFSGNLNETEREIKLNEVFRIEFTTGRDNAFAEEICWYPCLDTSREL